MSDPVRERRLGSPLVVRFIVVLACVGAPARDARAQAAPEARPRPEIWVHVAADSPVVDALADRLGARLEALGATMALEGVGTVDIGSVLSGTPAPGGDANAPLAEVWLDGRAAREVTLVLVPRVGDRVLARRIAVPAGFDEVALAEIVYIVDRAVQTLLASEPVGVPREEARATLEAAAPEAPPPAAPPPPAAVVASPKPKAAPPERPLAFQLGVVAGAAMWSTNDPLLPAGGAFGALERVSGRGRIGVVLGAGLRGIVRTETTDARVSVIGGEAHAWLTLGRSFARAGLWHLSLGPGIVVSRVDVTPVPSPSLRMVAAGTRTDVDPALGVSLRWDVAAVGQSVVFAAAGVDVLPRAPRYTAVIDGVTSTLFAPWPVRPSLVVGFALDLNARRAP